jgi:hypothetical protein
MTGESNGRRKVNEHMENFQITAKCEEVEESSDTNQSTGEVVTKIQLSLVVPSMRERVLCELPLDLAPKPELLERWELEESWLVVGANGMRALAFTCSNVRAGEKTVGSMVIFQAAAVREASPEERRQLQEARKAQKTQSKQRRAQRQAQKQAAREAASAADQVTA